MMHQISFDQKHSYEGSPRIEVYVTLKNSGQALNLQAFVDTGADYCVFQPDIAEALNLELRAGQLIKIGNSAGSKFDAYGHEIEIECCGTSFHTMVYFADVPEFRRNILGCTGWLDQFRIAIIHHDSELYLSHYNL